MSNNEDMLKFIEDAFEMNYEILRSEGGHLLSPHAKKQALDQVNVYWKKLKHLAESVSETEVKLTLPNQSTPAGRNYTIQGVVDVVKEEDRTNLYDIKSHDVEYVKINKHEYEGQLNIYSYIWESMRGERLDRASIIATGESSDLKKAKLMYNRTGDETYLLEALEEWDPKIDIEVTPEKVQSYIDSFGKVVDMIEEHKFGAPSVDKLKKRVTNNKSFVEHVCNNCDVRFSCDSFKEYAMSSPDVKRKFLKFYNDFGVENEREDFIEANLEKEE